jgi:hypothetical protein
MNGNTNTRQQSTWAFRLFFQALKRLFVNNRKEFLGQLTEYLQSDMLVPLTKNEERFVHVKSYDTRHYFLNIEVFISFELHKNKGAQVVLSALAKKAAKEDHKYHFVIEPGLEITGGQLLYYTFSNLTSFENNRKDFIQFIQEEYSSIEDIREENTYYWNILKQSKDNNTTSEIPE